MVQTAKESNKIFIPLQSGVNYCSLALPGVRKDHKDYAKLQVLSLLLSYNYLHPVIREKGGAYGAGLRSDSTLKFYSFRDPGLDGTLEAFYGTPKWLRDANNYSDADIEEAKLSLLGSLDAPVVPSRRGISFFTQGITDELRQQVRDSIFATTRDDIVQMADIYFDNNRMVDAPVAVIGNSEQIPEGWEVNSLE